MEIFVLVCRYIKKKHLQDFLCYLKHLKKFIYMFCGECSRLYLTYLSIQHFLKTSFIKHICHVINRRFLKLNWDLTKSECSFMFYSNNHSVGWQSIWPYAIPMSTTILSQVKQQKKSNLNAVFFFF